ncbi:MAG: NAD(P)-dependent oxidoreductase, partial [Mariprofundaceae bacterium]|nr:NAD(P)-dependent oxidoreductase [Mariprofundaceae bacterium]
MNTPLHIIADSNIWGAQQAFSALAGFDVRLDILEHQHITAKRVQDADILLVRSSTKVNPALLADSQVRFVGTATIGDDHVDTTYLQQRNIHFSSAAGSSTESVVEYMLAAFFQLEQLGYMDFSQDCLGIIGVGRIGGLLNQACAKLGVTTLLNDPPRQVESRQAESHDTQSGSTTPFQSLNTLLQQADILTLHTPLVQGKSAAEDTLHLLNAEQISQFKGKGIINAGRGACLDNQALLAWLEQDVGRFAVLDCWEDEPNI